MIIYFNWIDSFDNLLFRK